MPLTDVFCRSVKPAEKARKYFDAHGLFLYVTPQGGKLWRLKFRLQAKERLLALGKYPDVSLKRARELRDDARKLVAEGTDPLQHRKEIERERKEAEQARTVTFGKVAAEWLKLKRGTVKPDTFTQIARRLEKHVLPYLANVPLATLEPADVLKPLREVEKAGKYNLAHYLLSVIASVCKYARAAGLCKYNPAADLSDALKAVPRTVHRAAVTDPKDVAYFMQTLEACSSGPSVRYCLQLLPYVCLRISELAGCRWEDIDLERAVLTIPAERMKMGVGHTVPLSRQAVALFQTLKQFTGTSPRCFPMDGNKSKSVTRQGLLSALRRIGIEQQEMCLHGTRGMFSTVANGWRWVRPEWIEAALAHKEKDAVRASYNHRDYLPERRELMQAWADFLDELKADPEQAEAIAAKYAAGPNLSENPTGSQTGKA